MDWSDGIGDGKKWMDLGICSEDEAGKFSNVFNKVQRKKTDLKNWVNGDVIS